MKKIKRIVAACVLVWASTSFFTPPEADAICYLVRYNYQIGDCILQGDVMCRYCET